MKSLAEAKRQLTEGTQFFCEHFERPHVSGKRTILKAQTNAIKYTFHDDKGNDTVGWTHWPKTDQLRIEGATILFLNPNGTPKFQYTV